jgi:hypothetical protein
MPAATFAAETVGARDRRISGGWFASRLARYSYRAAEPGLFAVWVARFGCGALLFPDTLLWVTIFGVCQGWKEYLDKPQKS